MLAVFDTSPLNYLIQLDKAGLLPQIYGRVLAPTAVMDELSHPQAPPAVRAWALSPPAWLEKFGVSVDPTLSRALGPGEREAISLASAVSADILIVDDFKARTAASTRGIRIAGTIAVLREASRRGHVSLTESVDRLRLLGFRISPTIVADALAEYEQ